ncbi:hypothetical protein TIFTF001_025246 [Ficus carica]|uniref:Uncharacterized protein n=1 Tax=Ficus carica TaxID=3494 RepID=A0AA88AQY0_FICCA|nr:hypothetical protein TIFTF001_025246 [Ficus carica]
MASFSSAISNPRHRLIVSPNALPHDANFNKPFVSLTILTGLKNDGLLGYSNLFCLGLHLGACLSSPGTWSVIMTVSSPASEIMDPVK